MKTDLYTKAILTIIAEALTLNLVKSSITPAMADTKKYVALPVNSDGSINVNINKTDNPMDVNIKNVESGAFYYVTPISVKVSQ
jgi:predicted component of type VI protein secretion system